ncbi:MAG: hypothetical protein P4L80_00725 [Xanthobacteraceae bacterium]|nr:hypothetical protein [Xanthobacteraceae bacterium]
MINNADDCRKRADECLAAAHFASDLDIKRTWIQLSDLWQLWAKEFDEVRLNNEGSEVTGKVENSARSVVAAERTIGCTHASNGKAMKMADRLRVRLALSD